MKEVNGPLDRTDASLDAVLDAVLNAVLDATLRNLVREGPEKPRDDRR